MTFDWIFPSKNQFSRNEEFCGVYGADNASETGFPSQKL